MSRPVAEGSQPFRTDESVDGVGGAPTDRSDGRLSRVLTLLLVGAFCIAFLVAVSNLPGAAANYPRLVSAILLVLVGISLIRELLEWRGERIVTAPADGRRLRRAVLGVLRAAYRPLLAFFGLAGYVLLMPRLGFYPMTAALTLGLCLLLGLRRPLPLVGMVIGITAGSFVLFDLLLDVLLP